MGDQAGENSFSPSDESREGTGSAPSGDSLRNEQHDCEKNGSGFADLEEKLVQLFDDLLGREDGKERLAVEAGTEDLLRGDSPILGDYRIIGEIGSGGMATVYEAEQISLKRKVALKVLPAHLSVSQKAIQKFHREAIAGGRQKHPGIVAIHAVGEHQGVHFIAQELVGKGSTLANRLDDLRREDDLPLGYFRESAKLITAVAEALEHAHASGVIHRDVKPSNILLTGEGVPKLGDFGLARIEDALTLSRTGDLAGTPFYMSPEQVKRRPGEIDHRCDIFSLGATLYETLTLERPFKGETSREVTERILHHDPANLQKINGRIPRDISHICLKALEKNPDRRYQSMRGFADDLRRFLESEPIQARPAGRIRKSAMWIRNHKLLFFSGVVTGLSFVLAAILFYFIAYENKLEVEERARKFKQAKTALRLSETTFHYGASLTYFDPAESTHIHTLLEGAEVPFLQTILLIGNYQVSRKPHILSNIAACLEAYRKKCMNIDRHGLLDDTRYLLGMAKVALSGFEPDDEKKKNLIREGRSILEENSTGFDLFSPHAFVCQAEYPASITPEAAESLITALRIKEDHFLIDLFLGYTIFFNLHRGGERAEYDEAIHYFKKVLNDQPNNCEALTLLGRTYFFYAMIYDCMNLAIPAEKYLNRAIQAAEDQESPIGYLAHATLGEVLLLLGKDDLACGSFRRSIDFGMGKFHVQNAFRGMGIVAARKGNREEALKYYDDGIKLRPYDNYLLMAKADLLLHEGDDLETARKCTEQAKKRPFLGPHKPFYADVFLVDARLSAKDDNNQEARMAINDMSRAARFSPRVFGMACLLLITFPEESINQTLFTISKILGSRSADSPVSLTARGAARYCDGRFQEAVHYLEEAMKRRSEWPDAIRKSRRLDDACDLYLLAMVNAGYAEKDINRDHHEKMAHRYFERAERIYDEEMKRPFIRYRDIWLRLRRKAADVMSNLEKE